MDAERGHIHLEGPVGLSFVDRALDAVESLWERTSAGSAEDRLLFGLAVSEVATNIVRHAHVATAMSIEVSVTPDELRATIRDDAEPTVIDWADIAMPEPDAEGGRGLALAREVLDGFTHVTEQHANTWTLVRRVQR